MRRKATKLVVPRQRVKSRLAPAAIGPYSQAIVAGDTLYCSGMIAIDAESGHMINDNIEVETEKVLNNMGAVLKAANMSFQNVVRCTVFLADIKDYAQVNEVYARYFDENPPSREALQVAALPRDAHVEISCIAVR